MSVSEKFELIADKVYEEGQKSEYDRFWDNFQQSGKRTNYYVAFYGEGWNNTNFKPKYQLNPTSLNNTFASSKISGDFRKLCELDTSNCTTVASAFSGCSELTHLGVLDLLKITASTAICGDCPKLEYVEKIILNTNGKYRMIHFNNDIALKEIRFEGKMGGGDVSFANSPNLSYKSLESIKKALAEITTTFILTLHADAKAKLTDADIAEITQKGWTLA